MVDSIERPGVSALLMLELGSYGEKWLVPISERKTHGVSRWRTMKMNNPWKQKFPEQGCIRRIPRAESHKNMKIQDMLFTGIGVRLVSNVEVLVESKTEEEERERTTPTVALDYGFLTQENGDTFPILICRDSRYGQTGATCCERKGLTAYSISVLVGFMKDLGFFAESF